VSKRCRLCGKILIKPELIGSKTNFKRQHVALFHLPNLSLGASLLRASPLCLAEQLTPSHHAPTEEAKEEEEEPGSGWWALRVVVANPPQRTTHLPITLTASVVSLPLSSPLHLNNQPGSLQEGASEIQPGQPVETFLGMAADYEQVRTHLCSPSDQFAGDPSAKLWEDQFWESDTYNELQERDLNQNQGVVLHRHLNKVALRYRVGPLSSGGHVKVKKWPLPSFFFLFLQKRGAHPPIDPVYVVLVGRKKIYFRMTLGSTPMSGEATVDARIETFLAIPETSLHATVSASG